ncbi:MAG: ROK family protein [Chloroflexi bacterium]|nr:ROK family protein [Chloroflexota bacterium]
MAPIYGAIETGGTKCICMVASSPAHIFAEVTIPTETPAKTTTEIAEFFHRCENWEGQKIERVGLASFGPLDLNPKSKTYGHILITPKIDWQGWDLLGEMERNLNLPVVLDTDVNGAALGEYLWGAAQGLKNFIYLTIGTGIGGGGMIESHLLHGLVHPEMGHILIPHDRLKDPFPGVCPFHGDCFEGLASGPAMESRWRTPAFLLPEEHSAWDLEAQYIAWGLHNLICSLSPERVILGGGVMQQTFLFDKIRKRVNESLAGYVNSYMILDNIEEYIVPPALGNRAGVLGALGLAITGTANVI